MATTTNTISYSTVPYHVHSGAFLTSSLYDLNNHGVDFLNHGDLPQAFQAFRSCLSQLHSEMCTLSSSTTLMLGMRMMPLGNTYHHPRMILPLSPSCAYGSSHDNSQHMPTAQPWHNRFNQTTSQQEQNEESGLLLFLLNIRGIRVPSFPSVSSSSTCCGSSGLFSLDPQHEANVFSALLVYHLGLVCHLASLVSNDGTTSPAAIHHHNHNHAKALYEQAQQLLSISVRTEDCSSTGNAIVDLLHLSLLNNRAQLLMAQGFHHDDHEDNHDHEMSRHLLGRLIRLALHVKATLLYNNNNNSSSRADDGITSHSSSSTTTTTSSSSSSSSTTAQGWMMEQVDTYLFHAAMVGLLPLRAAAAAAA
jgi:hypothetical protein